ncbi:MAG: ABC transporter permease [Lachnospirales bacterium]
MAFKDIFKTAFYSVFSNKVRTFLTMLGIIIGISSVIIISSISAGSQANIDDQFSSIGAGNITVSMNTFRGVEDKYLLSEDEMNVVSKLKEINYVSPVQNYTTEIKLLDKTNRNTAILTGVNENYFYFDNPDLIYGEYISENDVKNKSKVAVITNTTALKVFGEASKNIIGKEFSLNSWKGDVKYTVVGIVHNENTEEEMLYPNEYNEEITVPYSSLYDLTYSDTFSSLAVVVADPESDTDFSTLITDRLNSYHDVESYYRVMNLMDIADNINSVTSTVAALVLFVACISLFVGGVGVMNIMLVTVTERTKEIGIRKSIGAKKHDILIQFLLEALTLTSVGGVIGIIIGIIGGEVIGYFMGTGSVVYPSSIIVSVGVSTFVGIVFGVYPANKASKLNPIDALRYE